MGKLVYRQILDEVISRVSVLGYSVHEDPSAAIQSPISLNEAIIIVDPWEHSDIDVLGGFNHDDPASVTNTMQFRFRVGIAAYTPAKRDSAALEVLRLLGTQNLGGTFLSLERAMFTRDGEGDPIYQVSYIYVAELHWMSGSPDVLVN